MKILLLGGTGAIGAHLKDVLIELGYNVFITSRKKYENTQHLQYIHGDAHDFSFLSLVLQQDWDAIVDFMVYSKEEFKQRVDLLLNSTNQYIFISSSRVYANSETPIKENSIRLIDSSSDMSFLATEEYSLIKARQEDILTKSFNNNYTIIRPYITYSEKRLQLGYWEFQQWLPRALDGRSIVFSRDVSEHYTTLTYGQDVAKGIAALIGHPKALGEIFNITCGEAIKWKEVLTIYLDTIDDFAGFRPKVKWIEKSPKLNRKESKYQIVYDRMYDRIFDNSKIISLVPSITFITPKEGLKNCLTVLLQSSLARRFSLGTEAVLDRITGERMSLSNFTSKTEMMQYIMYRYLCLDKLKN